MTTNQFRQLAAYNRWANARLYAAALDLSDQAYRLHIGVFFGNPHGTLNHLLLADRLWLKRLTGEFSVISSWKNINIANSAGLSL
jgi:uncharacterized damage-inducible protein DinB